MRHSALVALAAVVQVLAPVSMAFATDAVTINGFLTTSLTSEKNSEDATYNNGTAKEHPQANTRDNRVGIQIAAPVNPELNATAQLVARGGVDQYHVGVDWAYVDYKPSAYFDAHVGKYKISQFLVSDFADIGYAYPWVRPPQDVYSTNPLISLSGVDLFFTVPVVSDTKLTMQAFYGDGTHKTFIPARTIDVMGYPFEKGTQVTFDTNQTKGWNVTLQNKIFRLRTGYFSTKVDAPDFGLNDVWGSFGGAGFSMEWHNVVAYSEYIKRNTAPEMAGAFPDQRAHYETLGYRMGAFLPTVTHSRLDPSGQRSPLQLQERSTAIGLRYELGSGADIKFEWMRVDPKNGNHGLFSEPVESGKVYTVSLDAIF